MIDRVRLLSATRSTRPMGALNLVIIEAATERGDAWSGCTADAAAAVARLNHVGIHVALLTAFPVSSPQPDVAAINRYNATLHRAFVDNAAQVDALLFCPHATGEECDCRLPSPRLLQAACRRFCTDPTRTAVIGASVPLAMAAQRGAIRLLRLATVAVGSGDRLAAVGNLREGVDRLLSGMPSEYGAP
jgi:hypothetical protein